MARTKRSLEERIEEKLSKEQEFLQKAKEYSAQAKKLEQQRKAQERKVRNHLLIRMGAVAESVLKRPIEEDDIDRFLRFLNQQEQRGGFFTKAMSKTKVEDKALTGGFLIPEETDGGM